jgi:ABC-type Fe3+/spermidine/putrescine transport system ATPase subunit
MPFLTLSHISKHFGATPVLQDVSLAVEPGEILCLLGPSGCGKTTLLRIVAGLETPDQGQILVQGNAITTLPSHRRDFGLMFQDYVLFPHMTVGDNVAFGLKMHRWPRARRMARVQELLALVELSGYENRPVYELSGGQQQRVALARSLAPNPQLLMLDEPLGALDRTLRDQLLVALRKILKQLGQTALYVTHDQIEAFAVADRVALMRAGRIEQLDTPEALYLRPASPFAAAFLGMENILQGTLISLRPPIIRTPAGLLQPHELPAGLGVGATVQLVIRPEGARLAQENEKGPNVLALQLLHRSFRGAHTLMQFAGMASASELRFEFAGAGGGAHPGQSVRVTIEPDAIVVF